MKRSRFSEEQIIATWRIEYNQVRPHSALGYQTSEEFAARHNPNWGVVSKDLNNPKRLFTTGSARADRLWEGGLAGSS
jgi:hypothetical protein